MKTFKDRPDTLELTDEQAHVVAEAFSLYGNDLASVALEVYTRWRRIAFKYFMVPVSNKSDMGYRFKAPNMAAEGLELLTAAMRKLGAIVTEDGKDCFVAGHPLVVKVCEVAKFELPKSRDERYETATATTET